MTDPVKAIAAIIDQNKYLPWTVDRAEQMAVEILALLPQPTGEPEPMAWIAEQFLAPGHNGGPEYWSARRLLFKVPEVGGWSGWRNVQPLYATPADALTRATRAEADVETLTNAVMSQEALVKQLRSDCEWAETQRAENLAWAQAAEAERDAAIARAERAEDTLRSLGHLPPKGSPLPVAPTQAEEPRP